jgi:purine-binding chemotaxis protein CheW
MLSNDRGRTVDRVLLGADRQEQQYLSFPLGTERFAIEILRVQEIRALTTITPIPNAPAHIRGVINLRGTIVPVLDLRLRFGLSTSADPRFAIILVISTHDRVVGLVADAVPKVLTASADEIAPAPAFGQNVDTSFINGVLTRSTELIILLDLQRLLATELAGEPLAAPPESAD